MSESASSEAQCKVALRVRPLNAHERLCETKEWCTLDCESHTFVLMANVRKLRVKSGGITCSRFLP